MTLEMHPEPIPCRRCGTILRATFADADGYRCPTCGEPVCYICGCSMERACVVEVATLDGTRTKRHVCSWSDLPGTCSHCFRRAVYELYQQATGRPANDPFYIRLGRSAFGQKGLGNQ